MSFQKLKEQIELSNKISGKGKFFVQQALENYMSKVFNMTVIECEHENGEYKFITKSNTNGYPNQRYVFICKTRMLVHTDADDFHPRDNMFTLVEVYDEVTSASYKLKQDFYPMESRFFFNNYHHFMRASIEALLAGVYGVEEEDEETKKLKEIVSLLKKTFESKSGYKYEEEEGKVESFIIRLFGNQILIYKSFSYIVVDFKGKLSKLEIDYLDDESIEETIEKVENLIDEVEKWNIVLNNHNISGLYDFIRHEMKAFPKIRSQAIMEQDSKEKETLFEDFVIGKRRSHKQVEITIKYDTLLNNFVLITNYLFEESQFVCQDVNEIKSCLNEVNTLLAK